MKHTEHHRTPGPPQALPLAQLRLSRSSRSGRPGVSGGTAVHRHGAHAGTVAEGELQRLGVRVGLRLRLSTPTEVVPKRFVRVRKRRPCPGHGADGVADT